MNRILEQPPKPKPSKSRHTNHKPASRRPDVAKPQGELLQPPAPPRRALFEVRGQGLHARVPEGVEVQLEGGQPVPRVGTSEGIQQRSCPNRCHLLPRAPGRRAGRARCDILL